MRDGVAGEVSCSFGRGIHGVADGGVVRAVEGSALLSRDAGLTGTLFASSDQVLWMVTLVIVSQEAMKSCFKATHLTVPGEVDLQRLPVVLKPERSHGEQDVFPVDGFTLLLLAFLRSWWYKLTTAFACNICHLPGTCWYVPSLVMNEMNSDTHSCMHSFASFAILAFSGKADFMILATGAKFCMLASGWM